MPWREHLRHGPVNEKGPLQELSPQRLPALEAITGSAGAIVVVRSNAGTVIVQISDSTERASKMVLSYMIKYSMPLWNGRERERERARWTELEHGSWEVA